MTRKPTRWLLWLRKEITLHCCVCWQAVHQIPISSSPTGPGSRSSLTPFLLSHTTSPPPRISILQQAEYTLPDCFT
ncbi:hypothetical protein BDZ89DRAFT_1085212 [Hymenopellis radicata]|nr:hypothetical protein BDZ89DRAFT_1085212 [Hymenopellis radicata]